MLRMGGLNWFLFVGLSAGFLYMLGDEFGISAWLWKTALAMSLVGGTLFCLASLVCKAAPPSVLWRMTFTGVLLCPVLVIFGTMSLAYLATTSDAARPWLWLLIVGVTVLWCLITLSSYKQRVIDRRFIEREFLTEQERIVVRQPLKTDLDPKPISEHTLFGKVYHRFGPYLVMGVPMAYPIQRLLTDASGEPAALLLLSILGLPITIYLLGRLTCGSYLWIYRVWQLQRQYGKPVVFDIAD